MYFVPRYSKQFRFTMAMQAWKSQEHDDPSDVRATDFTSLPEFLNIDNYFGKLLDSYPLMVMEIMSHNILRANPLREKWLFLDFRFFHKKGFCELLNNALGKWAKPGFTNGT